MARELVENLAFEVMERAAKNSKQAELQGQQGHQLKHRNATRAANGNGRRHPDGSHACGCQATEGGVITGSKKASGVKHGPNMNAVPAPLNGEMAQTGQNGVPNEVAIPGDGTLEPSQCYSPGVMNHMKKKLSNNIEHYSNILTGVAADMLFRRSGKARSRSRSRSKSQDKSYKDRNYSRDHIKNCANGTEGRVSDEDEYVFVEAIELHSMDGLSLGGKELGRGHHFIAIQLKAPTWCDKCGDFIWGVIKQCLKCTSQERHEKEIS